MAAVTRFFQQLGLVTVDESAAPLESFEPVAEAATPTPPISLPDAPAVSFDDVYDAAKITVPPHGFTVHKMIEMLAADEFKGMDPAMRIRVFSGMLQRLPGGPVPFSDIVADAAARDKALDTYESAYVARVANNEKELRDANAKLEAEMAELIEKKRRTIEENTRRIAEEKSRLAQWRARKEAEETKILDAVRPFAEAEKQTASAG